MLRSKKILALSKYIRLGASSRLRIHQYIPYLQKAGFEVYLSPLLGNTYLNALYNNNSPSIAGLCGLLRRLAQLLGSLHKYDLLWIEYELFPFLPSWFEQVLHKFRIPYVVDYDDAIFHNYDLSNNIYLRLLRNKIDIVMQNAKAVICGNSYLADRARCAGAHEIEIIPTVIDLSRYTMNGTRSPTSLPFIIGWIGSPATSKYLSTISNALLAFSENKEVQLRIIGAEYSLPRLDVHCIKWSESTETSDIRSFHVGIMPLSDTPWERGKCGYKLIQYMASSVPVIASPVGANNEIVLPEINGFLANSHEEWVNCLEALYYNPERRVALGRMGRKSVEEKYCLQVTAPRIAEFFERLIA